jgi:asparagine synthase (glutamine-hydrolysing)
VILGIVDSEGKGSDLRQELCEAFAQVPRDQASERLKVWGNGQVAFGWLPSGIKTLDEPAQPCVSQDETIGTIFEGKIFNLLSLRKSLSVELGTRIDNTGEAIIALYRARGDAFLRELNGKFAIALWDATNRKLLLARDHFGIESLFYFSGGKRLIFSSSLKALLATRRIDKQLNYDAVLQYLLYCYNPGDATLVRNVQRVPAGHFLSFTTSGASLKRYWQLSFAETESRKQTQYCDEILNLIEDAVRIRLEPSQAPGVFLSGGTDSSAIVSLTSKLVDGPLFTFSFRCQGPSYDESSYARFVANHFGTNHTEIDYGPARLALITEVVRWMDEPFCDLGIEIGTFLLGQAATGKVSYVFSGEGGDELFGGHPVYVADKVAAFVDPLPRAIVTPIARSLQSIPDSDQKKNLGVKLKRFAYSLAFPRALLSHRWRIYYTPEELRQLCTTGLLAQCDMDRMYDGIFKLTHEADGKDQLSRSLYSDYYTLVSFYLRRLQLLRAFSIESRLPLLDYRLVEYAAGIPSRLKIRGFSDTKYIYKKALEPVVPGEILYNRPKLGHSIPMKNWLRDDTKVSAWTADALSNGAIVRHGLFRPETIRQMIDEHKRKLYNHSHRLWALLVLHSWIETNFDSQ